jgi:dynein light chain roadblock-type
MDNELSVHYAALVVRFTAKTRDAVKRLDRGDTKNDEPKSISIRSKKHTIVIAPDFDRVQGYQLIVVQATG